MGRSTLWRKKWDGEQGATGCCYPRRVLIYPTCIRSKMAPRTSVIQQKGTEVRAMAASPVLNGSPHRWGYSPHSFWITSLGRAFLEHGVARWDWPMIWGLGIGSDTLNKYNKLRSVPWCWSPESDFWDSSRDPSPLTPTPILHPGPTISTKRAVFVGTKEDDLR